MYVYLHKALNLLKCCMNVWPTIPVDGNFVFEKVGTKYKILYWIIGF